MLCNPPRGQAPSLWYQECCSWVTSLLCRVWRNGIRKVLRASGVEIQKRLPQLCNLSRELIEVALNIGQGIMRRVLIDIRIRIAEDGAKLLLKNLAYLSGCCCIHNQLSDLWRGWR